MNKSLSYYTLLAIILAVSLSLSGCWEGFGGVMAPDDSARGISAGADTDPGTNEVSLPVSISHADDESDIDEYRLYWGSSPSTRLSGVIASFPAKGTDISYTIPENTVFPAGASLLLVVTANKYGEISSGTSCPVTDRTVPLTNAAGISFPVDSDGTEDELTGTVTVTPAADESNITEYRLYWGENAVTKSAVLSTAIETLAASGSNLNFTLAADSAVPAGATHLLVYTANDMGESASGIGLDFEDAVVQMVANIDGDSDGSNPEHMAVFNGELYFAADGGSNGTELWRYNGISAPEEAADIYTGDQYNGSNPCYLTVFQGELYFQADNGSGNGEELWKYNGTSASEIADIIPGIMGSEPSYMTIFNNKLYFQAGQWSSLGAELWSYDGTNAPSLVVDIYDGSGSADVSHLAVFNNALYFQARDEQGHSGELWKYDGTNEPSEIADMYDSIMGSFNPVDLVVFNDTLFFSAEGPDNGMELWSYNANPVAAEAFTEFDLYPGFVGSQPEHLAVYRNKLYFQALASGRGYELWCYDGTNAPSVAMNIDGDNGHSEPKHLTVFNDKLYFSANADNGAGRELWVYYTK
ncbi:MAG: hypothetical protein GY754_44015 [bacterium]|nr:hypothetical protein [bacterium]